MENLGPPGYFESSWLQYLQAADYDEKNRIGYDVLPVLLECNMHRIGSCARSCTKATAKLMRAATVLEPGAFTLIWNERISSLLGTLLRVSKLKNQWVIPVKMDIFV